MVELRKNKEPTRGVEEKRCFNGEEKTRVLRKMWGRRILELKDFIKDGGWVPKCRMYEKALQKPATFLTKLNIQAQNPV